MSENKNLFPSKHLYSWLPKDKKLIPFYWGMVKFIEDYTVDVKESLTYQDKVILDPSVNYIKFYSWEVALIDTPLFQRLRSISQLGLAYTVYPTLRYSRFEHTLGVVGRLNQVLQVLREKHRENKNKEEDTDSKVNIEDILKRYENCIRLSALFHDIGHCLFSHLGEFVVDDLPGIEDDNVYPSTATIRQLFSEHFKLPSQGISIAEIFSVVILSSKRIAEILKSARVDIGRQINSVDDREMKKFIENSARFVMGLPAAEDPNTIFLAQLISSGLDVDKLDYMSREEHFSGIKIEMDLQRLFNKIKLFTLSSKHLPKAIKRYTSHYTGTEKNANIVLGIERGGQFAYEEFCVARLALYEKIYLHKKVRAAEKYLIKKLLSLTDKHDYFKKAHNWLYLPESIVERKIYQKIPVQLDLFAQKYIDESIGNVEFELLEISRRRLPYRAYGFGPANTTTDTGKIFSVNTLNGTGIDELQSIRLWDDLLNPVAQDDLQNEILDELWRMFRLLSQNADSQAFPELQVIDESTIKEVILDKFIIDIPKYKRVELKYDSIHFEEANFQPVRWTIPIDQIAKSYQLHRIVAYIFAGLEYCPYILLACEKLFYMKHQLFFEQSIVVSSEVLKRALEVKEILKVEDYYKDCEVLLPLPKDLKSVSTIEKINDILTDPLKLKYFKKRQLSLFDVQNYLNQFPEEHLRLAALALLDSIRLLSENELDDVIEERIEYIKSQKGPNCKIGIIALGEGFSSAIHMQKNYKRLTEQYNLKVLTPSDTEIVEQDHLIFFDDNVNSGTQALNIFATWLGIDKSHLRNENRFTNVEEKSDAKEIKNVDIRNKLLDTDISIIFITGSKRGLNLKPDLVKFVGLKEERVSIFIKHMLQEEFKIFSGNMTLQPTDNSIFAEIYKDFHRETEKIEELKKFMVNVGEQIVQSKDICKEFKHDAQTHALGYYNQESLVIFPNSVPTMTLTALWHEGRYKDSEGNMRVWKPLIPRNA